MKVRLLGPLEVADGGPIRGARERRLLALLALEAPAAVSRSAAIDWLFGNAPAEDGPLSVAVSRLRRQLRERGMGAAIERSAAGLRLAIDPTQIDSWRFRNLAAEARAVKDPAERADLLRDALDLWRGEVLEGEDVPAGPAVTVLAELRLACVEQRFAAELEAGAVDAVAAGELMAWWRAHPERETLCQLAMLALYQNGRQLDALALFRAARRALLERGLEPGVALVELEAAIVRHDPSLQTSGSDALRMATGTDRAVASPPPSVARPVPAAAELSSFVGRANELAELSRLLHSYRLITVTGPGGVGKTRLALRASALSNGGQPFPVVELAAITETALVPTAFAEALQLSVPNTRDPLDALVDHLRGRTQPMLVVDNCEHLVAVVAAVLARLLKTTPALRVLATSREPLRVEGELVYPLAPLAVTRPDGGVGPAVQLFFNRARTGGNRLPDDAATCDIVATVCDRLDGLPLAIELAAARSRSLSLVDLHDRLDHRFRLLTAGVRGVAARHRTLEATVAWSHDLLDTAARHLFDVASVFAGGFELDAVTHLLGADEFDVLDGLDQLVERSLLQASHRQDAPTRFSMLETMRQFGRDKLLADKAFEAVRDRHLDWLWSLARQQSPALQLSLPSALDRIDRELANLRLGLEWAGRDAARAAIGLQVTLALSRYWYQRGITAEATHWIETLTAQGPELDDATRALLLCDLGFHLLQAGRAADALDPLEESLELSRAIGDDGLLTRDVPVTPSKRSHGGSLSATKPGQPKPR